MSVKSLVSPNFGDSLSVSSSFETLSTLNTRRSTLARQLSTPGPTHEEVHTLIRLAARVPDHGRLFPWRFLVIQGQAREKLGNYLYTLKRKETPELKENLLDLEKNRFLRAPTVIAILSISQSHPKVPKWEQVLSAGAACQNLLHAANAMGYGAQWLTEWYAYHTRFLEFIGVQKNEKIAGFIYIGTAQNISLERARPDTKALTTYL